MNKDQQEVTISFLDEADAFDKAFTEQSGFPKDRLIKVSTKKVLELWRLYQAVKDLPFGESSALPFCRESFPRVDRAMKVLDELFAQDTD